MKRQLYYLTALLSVMIIMTGCTLPQHTRSLNSILDQNDVDRSLQSNFRCTMGAHRGASDKYVENTHEALLEANESGKYDFIELDVQFSSDDRIVVFHDQRLIRMFGSLSSVGNSTFAELTEKSDGEIAAYDETIPHLNKKLNIEIKSQGDLERDKRLVDEIVADLRSRKRINDVAISSISEDVVKYVKRTYPGIPTGQIFWVVSSTYLHFDMLTQRLFDDINETEADYIMLYVANLRNIEDLLKLKPKNKTLVFWDFDDTMFIVHKDNNDRMWGESYVRTLMKSLRYKFYSLF